ncbi:Eco57I restriction-modification methylase domain-containing protein, partial [Candidatus Amarolinea dominans]|uniref:Eco57I restriction-modification methylase domain-containing protein n=1 Tax=Candidatus Amarolinea dominans TaxID=3140696 RepID=UPI0031CC5D51
MDRDRSCWARQYLLDWHLAYYLEEPERWLKGKRPALERVSGGATRLTIEERKRILMDHLYGVDIDPQAVEVTKLSLLLKVLEGEGVAGQLSLGVERVLPDLGRNIKCGNSLIGPEFYDGKLDLPDDETVGRVNAFDWKKEFPEVMTAGGFDAIIGNPPYIRIQALQEWAPLEVVYYKRAYRAASKGNYDIYVVFVEKGLGLLNERGSLGFILPHKFFNAQYGEPLRKLLSEGQHLSKVVHFGDQQVFEGATTYTCLLFLERGGRKEFQFVRAHDLPAWRAGATQVEGTIPAVSAGVSEWNFVVGRGSDLFERLRGMPVKLADVAARMAQGIRTSANEVYVLDLIARRDALLEVRSEYLNKPVQLDSASVLQFLQGREIKAYRIAPSGKVVIFPYQLIGNRAELLSESLLRSQSPDTFSYLQTVKKYLQARERGKFAGADWYAYGRRQNIELMSMPKILVPDIADRAAFALDAAGQYAFTSGYGITLKADTG